MPAYFRITGDEVEKAQNGPNIKLDPRMVNRSKFQDYARKQGMGEVNVHGADFKAGMNAAGPVTKVKNFLKKKSLAKIGDINKGLLGSKGKTEFTQDARRGIRVQREAQSFADQPKSNIKDSMKQMGGKKKYLDLATSSGEAAKGSFGLNQKPSHLRESMKQVSPALKEMVAKQYKKIGKCYEPYVQKDMYSMNPQYVRNPKSTNAVGAKQTKKK
jgi:hypothetical protein